MPFSFFDHTGDIGVAVSAPTLSDLFREAVEALAEAVTDPATVRMEAEVAVEVDLTAPALDLLLADWLREALYEFDAHEFLVRTAAAEIERSATGCRLKGTLRGERFDPARHGVKVLVKAVTYHGLDVRETSGGWSATVIFDI